MRPQVLRPYNPASWFHPTGIWKVLAKLEPKLPNVGGRLFLTFTLNPTLFAGPSQAFDCGRDHLRRVFFKLRKGVEWEGKRYVIDAPYCVKVEFHENGCPHFHVVFLTRRFLPGGLLNDLWALGRTNVGRIKNKDFRYLLKYVTKAADLPDWVKSRKRLRVFQSSRGFYVLPPEDRKPSRKTGRTRKTGSIGERMTRWERTGLLQDGDAFRQLTLGAPYAELLGDLILPVAQAGRYLGNGHILINDVSDLTPWIVKNPNKP